MSTRSVHVAELPLAVKERALDQVQHREAGKMPDSQTYSLRETAGMFGASYSGFREAMLREELPEGIKPFPVGGQWRFSKAPVHRVLGIED